MKFYEIDTTSEPLKCFVPLSKFQWKKNKIGQFILLKLRNGLEILGKAFPHNSDDFYGNCSLISSKNLPLKENGDEIEDFKFITCEESLQELFFDNDDFLEISKLILHGMVVKNNFFFNNIQLSFEKNEIFYKIDKTTKFLKKEKIQEIQSEEKDEELSNFESEIIEILSNYGKILIYGNFNKMNILERMERKMKKKFKNLNEIEKIKKDEIIYIENIDEMLIEETNFIEILNEKDISFIGGTDRSINEIKPLFKKKLKLIKLPLPTDHDREIIFNKFKEKFPNSNIDLNLLINSTNGFSEFEMNLLFRESFIQSKNVDLLNQSHISKALSIVKSSMLNKSEKFEKIEWDEIGGLSEVKLLLKQCSEWPILHKKSFNKLGITVPRGILLYGPPGCSKTKYLFFIDLLLDS
jgi:hypothetical protein